LAANKAQAAVLGKVECETHLFLYRLEFRRRPLSWAGQVDGDLFVDTTRMASHHDNPIRQNYRFFDVVCDQDQSEAAFLQRTPR
jgi:hypothetical protein